MNNSPYLVRLVTHRVPNQNLSQFISRVCILLSTTGLILTNGIGALSQEHPGCFMKTKAGEVMSLNGDLCIFPQDEKTIVSPLSTPGVYQAKIIKKQQGIPVIEAIFNDQVTFEMMVDTGASGTVITPMMAGRLKVVPTGRVKADTPSQKGVEFDLGSIQSLNVAGAVKSNLTVAIAPMLEVGLLGQDFFGEYDVTIKEDVVEFRARQ
ncbi:MAG TPA: retropepsin-like aspartic protease [Candidatus Obscuribacterales bacterium]